MSKYDVYCGGLTAPAKSQENTLVLDVHGKNKNVNLKIHDINRSMLANIPTILMDLLEVAAYVYCADQRVRRGGDVLVDTGSKWRRNFHFHIPVREPDKWNSPEVMANLTDTLWFLTEDDYNFTFTKAKTPLSNSQDYMEFTDDVESKTFVPDEVVLFSGGLDSFAGALDHLIGKKKKLAMVGHHSCPKVYATQKQLIASLKKKGLEKQMFYVPVEVTNQNVTPNEYTQRSRSFLYASLATVVAHLFKKDSITFFENGVVSLNIPISSDVVGARATRTTHPRVLEGFSSIYSSLLDKQFSVVNPYTWQTKADIARLCQKYECEVLIGDTRSCTRPRSWTLQHTHCGVCSQCIDRRFGIVAAGLGEHDPSDRYRVELLLGDRSNDREIVMVAHYVRFARDVADISLDGFQRDYPEVIQSVGHFAGLTTDQAIGKVYEMLKRHAADVVNVVEDGVKENARRLTRATLAPGSLLSLVGNHRGKIEVEKVTDTTPAIKEFLDRLGAPVCEFAVDEERERIVFSNDFWLDDKEYRLVKMLLPQFRAGRKKADGEIEFTKTEEIVDKLCMTDQSFRTFIKRLREKLEEKLGVDHGIPMEIDDFIENKVGAGYRLNKNLREMASPADLIAVSKQAVTA